MGKTEDIERFIDSVDSLPLQRMLRSVSNYNSYFIKSKVDEKLLTKILEAMSIVDRRFFVGDDSRNIENAYQDNVLGIGEGQTISQPRTVARMLVLAALQEGHDVLEVGAGSGWNAALIAKLVYPGRVFSVERYERLVRNAKENVRKLQVNSSLNNIEFLNENVFDKKSKIWKRKYDRIIITAGIPVGDRNIEDKVETLASSLLNNKGILVCPYTTGPIIIYRKNVELEREETKEQYSFVPLVEK